MKILRLPILLLAGGLCPALVGATSAPRHPPHIITNSELRVLPPAPNGRTYQLHVRLPASYAQQPERRYPVLYVTDGYWDFPTIVTSYDNLVYDRVVPEFIVVGLGYAGEQPDYDKLRGGDLSPVPFGENRVATGRAAEFLGILERDILPFIAREYRTDPAHRMIAGSSLGGLFALYALFTKPELFHGCIAASPATGIGDDWLAGYLAGLVRAGKPPQGRLYLTGAGNEWPTFLAAIKRFHERLAAGKYPGLTYEFRVIDGERHAGTKAESYVRGMRFIFAPLAPETGPARG